MEKFLSGLIFSLLVLVGFAQTSLEIETNSLLSKPHIRLLETGQDFARIKMENSANPGLFWDLAGETKGGEISRFNFYYFDGTIGRDRLTITGQGRVGINQANPQANLHVNGNVRITDLSGGGVRPVYTDANGCLTTGASQYLSLAGSSFHPEVDNSSISYLSAAEGAHFLNAPSGYNGLIETVHLPHGSTLRMITIYYEDSNPTYDAAFVFLYYKTPSNTFSSLANAFSSGSSGFKNVKMDNLNIIINNAENTYSLLMRPISPDTLDANFQINAVVFEYN